MNLLMLLVPVAFGMALGAIALTSTYMRLGSRLILVAVSAAMVGFGALGAAMYMSFGRIALAVVQIIFVGGAALLAIALALVVVALLRMVRRNRRMQTRLRRPSNSSPVEDTREPRADLMRWVWAAWVLAFCVVLAGVTLYQQIHVIIEQPSCGVSVCVTLVPNRGFAVAAALLAATETWLVGRLLVLASRRRRAPQPK